MPFTVYRAPQAVSRLAALAEQGRVRIVGDSEGVAITTGNHLDYLAVAEAARGKGLGRLLLEDLLSPRSAGFSLHKGRRIHPAPKSATLDALADSPARRLYERLGYQTQSESLNLRLSPVAAGLALPEPIDEKMPLKNTGKPPEDWSAALRDEERDGFAAVDHEGMRIGLIAGTALRLLHAGGRSVEEALRRIGDLGRQELILLGAERVPEGYEVIQQARCLRMVRNG